MAQQRQVFRLKGREADGRAVWAYRHRLNGRGSRRPQVGGFTSRAAAEAGLRRALDRLRPDGRAATLTLGELVEEYLEVHQAEPTTIGKLRWLLARATSELGEVRVVDPATGAGVRVAGGPAGGQPVRRPAGATPGSEPGGRVGADRLQSGEARGGQPEAAVAGEAAVRVMGGDRRRRRGARSCVRADGCLRGRDGAAPGRASRARTARCGSRCGGRLRAARIRLRTAEENAPQPPRGTATERRARGSRPAPTIDQPAALSDATAATSTCSNFR
jgi:hypothetical protein